MPADSIHYIGTCLKSSMGTSMQAAAAEITEWQTNLPVFNRVNELSMQSKLKMDLPNDLFVFVHQYDLNNSL